MPNKHINITATLVVFTVFTAEAILHYNIGVHKDKTDNRKFVLPPLKDLTKLVGITIVFSVLSGVLTAALEKK